MNRRWAAFFRGAGSIVDFGSALRQRPKTDQEAFEQDLAAMGRDWDQVRKDLQAAADQVASQVKDDERRTKD